MNSAIIVTALDVWAIEWYQKAAEQGNKCSSTV